MTEQEIFRQDFKDLQTCHDDLSEKHVELSGIFDAINSSSFVFHIDIKRTISFINQEALFLTGMKENDILGQYHKDFFNIKDDKEYDFFWEMLMSKETIQKEEYLRIGETELWFSIVYRPINDINGKILYIFCLGTNLTESKKLEREIKDKNTLVNQSLRYAKTIQISMLPSEVKLREKFQTELVFFPRDIVSGDFYWTANIFNRRKFVAAVDCTGHGVPGAFLSFVGTKALNEIVHGKQIFSPKLILDALNDNIKEVLDQKRTNNRDGMDVCMCAFEDTKDGKVKVFFTGAKLPLYYYKKSEKKIHYIKGSRKSIGGFYYDQHVFEEHELILEKGDILYLATDGYIDQDSREHKRFGRQRYKAMIEEIADLPIQKQRTLMEQIFTRFIGNEDQRDDVTVLIVEL